MDNAGGDSRGVRHGGAVGSCTRMGADRVARRIRAALSAGRAVVAGLGGLRRADAVADPRFCFSPRIV